MTHSARPLTSLTLPVFQCFRTILFSVCALGLGLMAPHASADFLSIDLNDDAARASYHHGFNYNGGEFALDAGWLHQETDGDLFHGGLYMQGNSGSGQHPIHTGLGARLYIADPEADVSGGALAIGGFFRYRLPRYNRVGFFGHLFYSPDVLAFSDADDLLEISLRANYDVLRNAWAYLGMRVVEMSFNDDTTAHFDTGLHAGIEFEF